MNKIIGTAGHVDHGKSALIYALTGSQMMRLPEEKKRGMTIDLGFANFSPKEGVTIGVIDVPGHEQFIRNMVAGMWSLDLVMLVVAANEGIKPMTEQHAKVAKSLRIRNVICVINKIDLVCENDLKKERENIKNSLNKIFERDIEIVEVSALKNIGIDNLKKLVSDILINEDYKEENEKKPYIYVDRVFSVKGVGTTITGSLKNGTLKTGIELIHYPSGETTAVKTMQAYHKETESVDSVSRVAISLKNIKKEDIKRGHLLFEKQDLVFKSKEIILELSENDTAEKLRKIKNVEFATGTDCLIAKVKPMFLPKTKENEKPEQDKRFIRLCFEENISVFWKSLGVLISHGGSTILGSGYVFFATETDFTTRKNISIFGGDFLGKKENADYKSLIMSMLGFIEAYGEKPKDAVLIGKYFVLEKYIARLKENIITLINKKLPNGDTVILSFDDIKKRLKLKDAIVKNIVDYFINEKIIMSFSGGYKKFKEAQNITLTNGQKNLLDKLKLSDVNGMEEKDLRALNALKDIKILSSLKLAVFLDEGIYYHTEVYKKIKSVILKNKVKNDIITIADMKTITGLSRKYTLPLLNAMERESVLKRQGNDRIVL